MKFSKIEYIGISTRRGEKGWKGLIGRRGGGTIRFILHFPEKREREIERGGMNKSKKIINTRNENLHISWNNSRLINFTLNDTNYTLIFLIDQLNTFISRSILLNRVLSTVWKKKAN